MGWHSYVDVDVKALAQDTRSARACTLAETVRTWDVMDGWDRRALVGIVYVLVLLCGGVLRRKSIGCEDDEIVMLRSGVVALATALSLNTKRYILPRLPHAQCEITE